MAERPESGPAAPPPPGVVENRTLEFPDFSEIWCCNWSPDGRLLAIGHDDGKVVVWDLDRKNPLWSDKQERYVAAIAFSADGRRLASMGNSLFVSDALTGRRLWTQSCMGYAVAFSRDGRLIASARGSSIGVCDVDGAMVSTFHGHADLIQAIVFSPDGRRLASASRDGSIRLWELGGLRQERVLPWRAAWVNSVVFSPDGRRLASAGDDRTIRLWDVESGRSLRVLEAHTGSVNHVVWTPDGSLLVSHGESVRIWRADSGEAVGVIGAASAFSTTKVLSSHSTLPKIAVFGDTKRSIRIWDMDPRVLLGTAPTPSHQYANAKVVLLGDTGVGKTGLANALTGEPYRATDSTHGRHVFTLERAEASTATGIETRETLLWDLAGQPGYRLIHQLHLGEVTVALFVFDARSETDPLAGVRHWERALRQARQRQGDTAIPLKKLLVVARSDRGGIAVSRERIEELRREMGFDGYFETSAREGWGIAELREAIRAAIDWEALTPVTSDELFQTIQGWLKDEKAAGCLLATGDDLFRNFCRARPEIDGTDLRPAFDTCLGRLENRDLLRRLSFGGYVLLQPEWLDAYASALVNAAREEPDGFGSIAEEDALAGRFRRPADARIGDGQDEQLVLLATVEELLAHELALREPADDGRYLVLPSQFLRDWPEAPEPPGRTVTFAFEGPVQSAYATLVVRLAHSGQFETRREAMWRNTAVYRARAGGDCGLYLREFADARGDLAVFFDAAASDETRFQFEEYARVHLERRTLRESIRITRSFVCRSCRTPVPDVYARGRLNQGADSIPCGVCDARVSLADPTARIAERVPSPVDRIDQAAREGRDFGAWLTSASGEARTEGFASWMGGTDATLAVVFTDAVGSTALAGELGDERMGEVVAAHFAKVRELIGRHGGREVKTLGDGFLAAFRSAAAGLDFAVAVHAETGHPAVAVRAAVHVGPVHVQEDDLFGATVAYTARVLGQAVGAEIWLSERARQEVEQLKAARHRELEWTRHPASVLKGFAGEHTLWSVVTPAMRRRGGAHAATSTDPAAALQRKIAEGRFDVFLCHNSEDRNEVKRIAERLKERGIQPWLDAWEIRPGALWQEVLARQIGNIGAAAVFVGQTGLGPWEDLEMRQFIDKFVSRRCPVIPVLLAGCERPAELPPFLSEFQFVDFGKADDALGQLVRGVTRQKP